MFEQLLKTAIIGIANGAQMPEIERNEIALPENIGQEEQILLASAFHSIQQKASYEASSYTQEMPPACPAEKLQYAQLSICELILRCMSKEQEDNIVVQEVLEKISTKNWIVLPHILPQLLDYGQNKPLLQPYIQKVAGERGKWLLSFNKSWKYLLLSANAGADWDTGTHEERLTYFRFWHKTNPTEATALLAQDWKNEILKNKKDFISIITEQANETDEAFLSGILAGEKDSDLRRKITEVLVQIPNSTAFQSLEKHVFECVKMKTGFLSLGKMEILLPTTLSPDLQDLGIMQAKAGHESSKHGIFAQILSLFPPKILTQKLKKTREELLALFEKNANNEMILSSLEKAAILHKDEEWLAALIFAKVEKKTFTPEMKKMQNLLSPQMYGELTEKVAKKVRDKQLMFFLANREVTWGDIETKIALAEMQQAVKKYSNARPWDCNDLKDLAKTASTYCKATDLKPFSDLLHQISINKDWERELKSCINRIDLRIQIAYILG